MFAIRDEIVTRIQTAAAADGKTLTVRAVVKPMPELEAAEFGGFLVEVARVAFDVNVTRAADGGSITSCKWC